MARKDPLKAKQRKQKIVAGVLGALLLGALGVSVPFTLKMMKGGANYDTNVVSTTTPATTTPPTLGSSAGGVTTTTASAELANSSSATGTAGFGQLLSFDRFQSKDPFVQQVDPSGGTEDIPGPTSSSSDTGSSKPPSAEPAPDSGGTSTVPAPTPPQAPAPTTAVISVNGQPADVLTPGTDFPVADPMFSLVALTRNGAKIAIAGGSYQSGAATAVLKRGKKLTLVNTADGTRYELTLLWLGAGAPPPEIAAKTAQAQSSTSAPAPTTAPPTTSSSGTP
jgi:hypothetical protein